MSEEADQLEPPAVRASRLGIEHKAVSDIFCDWNGRAQPHGVSDGEVMTSIAISLKRVADALEKANEPYVTCMTEEQVAQTPEQRLAAAVERVAAALENHDLLPARRFMRPGDILVGEQGPDIVTGSTTYEWIGATITATSGETNTGVFDLHVTAGVDVDALVEAKRKR